MKLPAVGVCAIFKNEAPYLREWVAFYLLSGVDRFFLYDNGSSDDWGAAIPELVDDVVDWPGPHRQEEAYQHCLQHRADTEWLAFVDIDEYVWDPAGRTLPEVLGASRASAVRVPWRMFGDGGHRGAPALPTIDAFLRCADDVSELGKMIVRSGAARMVLDPHTVAVRGRVVTEPALRLNHYWTRSEAEVRAKFARGRAATGRARPWSEYTATREAFNADIDARLSRLYGKAVRAALEMPTLPIRSLYG